jgi:peptide/nickel transport system permease protein
MLAYLFRRVVYTLPIMLGVALVCFALVHLAPGDPLVSILPPDASADLQAQLRTLYGFDRSCPSSSPAGSGARCRATWAPRIATGRAGHRRGDAAVGNTLMLAVVATLIGFFFGCLFGFVAGYFRTQLGRQGRLVPVGARRERAALLAGHGAGDHVLAQLNWLPPPAPAPAARATGPGTGST